MARSVKGKRRYDSSRRRAQAAETREEILAAAQRLFEEQGYAGTTMAAIASEAGVALKTVYIAFETKSGLLRALWNRLLRGDRDEVPVAEQPWYREMLDEPDPERQLRLNARNARAAKVRMGAILEVIRSAALAEPELAALWARIEDDFYENQRRVIASVAEKGALTRGLDISSGTDILWTLNHPSVWQLLVRKRGWSPDRFEKWLADSFCQQLLR
ncbi:MAG TPA: helix-turn-helix domain-containing protein [Solirubrobacterales bacterium]|nr:helix-turn-helix domain-containing protein [Solirubrobacterales bacterium]